MAHTTLVVVGADFRDYESSYRVLKRSTQITSYAVGGEAFVSGESKLKAKTIDHIPTTISDTGHIWRHNPSTGKVQCYRALGGTVTDGPLATMGSGSSVNQVASGAAGFSDAVVHALAGVTGVAVTTGFTNPDTPRSVRVVLKSATGGTLPAAMGTCTIVGTDINDAAISDPVSLTSLNSVVLAVGGIVYIRSTKCFKTVTSYTFSVDLSVSIADIQCSIGNGTKLPLTKALATGTAQDVVLVEKQNLELTAFVVDTTNNAVEMGVNIATNDKIVVTYRTIAPTEAAAGDNCGTAVIMIFCS